MKSLLKRTQRELCLTESQSRQEKCEKETDTDETNPEVFETTTKLCRLNAFHCYCSSENTSRFACMGAYTKKVSVGQGFNAWNIRTACHWGISGHRQDSGELPTQRDAFMATFVGLETLYSHQCPYDDHTSCGSSLRRD
ncbi:hypothetical protein BaRGS_00034846 [Batillaria attramentaria]|uniref:Uncharacterized protein n=1 Tax=Batillaria attramentaria TaxID=370345 RepID=A0ABD0JH33_9CAEN